MQLLCLGDVALADKNLASTIWDCPAGLKPNPETRIMFNWEFPIGTTPNPQPRTRGSRFLAYPDSPNVVQKWAPGIATLATNHILDASSGGLANTIRALQEKGFSTVGAGMTVDEMKQPLFWETAEGKLAIVNWVFAETHPDWMTVPGPNCWPDASEARRLIQDLKTNADWVLVVAHWSDELFDYPLPQDRLTARMLIETGADVVVGHHPHVVRGMESIQGSPIFYSIGNFYFAEQIYGNGKITPLAPRNRECLGVKLIFKRNSPVRYELLSFWNGKTQTMPDPSGRAAKRLHNTSVALKKYPGEEYAAWYKQQRARFNSWGSRWHFGLRQRGLIGTIQRMLGKLRTQKS